MNVLNNADLSQSACYTYRRRWGGGCITLILPVDPPLVKSGVKQYPLTPSRKSGGIELTHMTPCFRGICDDGGGGGDNVMTMAMRIKNRKKRFFLPL